MCICTKLQQQEVLITKKRSKVTRLSLRSHWKYWWFQWVGNVSTWHNCQQLIWWLMFYWQAVLVSALRFSLWLPVDSTVNTKYQQLLLLFISPIFPLTLFLWGCVALPYYLFLLEISLVSHRNPSPAPPSTLFADVKCGDIMESPQLVPEVLCVCAVSHS